MASIRVLLLLPFQDKLFHTYPFKASIPFFMTNGNSVMKETNAGASFKRMQHYILLAKYYRFSNSFHGVSFQGRLIISFLPIHLSSHLPVYTYREYSIQRNIPKPVHYNKVHIVLLKEHICQL
jgi:hypothetical protein